MAAARKRIGILALQGDFERHREKFLFIESGLEPANLSLIRTPEQLSDLDGIVIPGGESTTLLKLLDEDFRQQLKDYVRGGLAVLATCAGAILLANKVENPAQESLELLDVTVSRNAYGRQNDSFFTTELTWTSNGRQVLETHLAERGTKYGAQTLDGMFIRAPKIISRGENVEILVEHGLDPVLVKSGSIFAATFHPELGENQSPVHELFLASIFS